jgi:hypothetical protein
MNQMVFFCCDVVTFASVDTQVQPNFRFLRLRLLTMVMTTTAMAMAAVGQPRSSCICL